MGNAVAQSSERMLRAVSGENFVALNGTERCCGAAGVYNMVQPEMSQRILKEKLDHVKETKCWYTRDGQSRLPDAHRRRRVFVGYEAERLSSDRDGGPGLRRRRLLRVMESKTLNQKTLTIFAPLLILVGIAGFVIPEQYSLTSGAAPYNLFHIFFGAIGLMVLMTNSDLAGERVQLLDLG